MRPFEHFDAWKAAHTLVLAVYRATDGFPGPALELTTHIRRAAILVPAKIASGSARRRNREFRRLLMIALGYLMELAASLNIALDMELLTRERWEELDHLRGRAAFYTWKLYLSQAPSADTRG